MGKQMGAFRANLQEFAVKYKVAAAPLRPSALTSCHVFQDEINSNPHFRMQFMKMCSTTGVDPLACDHCAPQ
jgi:hypothetical protein